MAQITVATSMTYFTFVTALAFVLKFYMAKSYSSRNQSIFSLVITIVYLAIILFIQLYVNYRYSDVFHSFIKLFIKILISTFTNFI